jgi:hypothetical protein
MTTPRNRPAVCPSTEEEIELATEAIRAVHGNLSQYEVTLMLAELRVWRRRLIDAGLS